MPAQMDEPTRIGQPAQVTDPVTGNRGVLIVDVVHARIIAGGESRRKLCWGEGHGTAHGSRYLVMLRPALRLSVAASEPRSLSRHGRRRPTIHEFASHKRPIPSQFLDHHIARGP